MAKAGCGYLADRIGVRRAFTFIQVLTAIGLWGVIVAPIWIAGALLIPLGAVVQGSSSITYGFAADLIDHRRMARGYALAVFVRNAGCCGGAADGRHCRQTVMV